jgi:signal transduction histidine kinase
MTIRTNRRIRLLTMAATPLLLVAWVSFAVVADASTAAIASVLVVAGSFLVTGFVAWANRPGNRMGPLMVALALSLLLSSLAQPFWPLLAPIRAFFFALASTLLGYLILAYPSGELRTTANRALVLMTLVLVGGPRLIRLVSQETVAGGHENPYLLIRDPDVARTMATLPYFIDIVVLVAFVAFVASRWLRASGPTRRSLSPVLIPTMGLLLVLVGDAIAIVSDVPTGVREFFDGAQLLARTAIPIGFLMGLLQTRIARSSIADLVVELGVTPAPARLREALANALGDSTLELAYWSAAAGTFVDADGTPIRLPDQGSRRAVTQLDRDGIPIAAIIHDPVLLEDPGLVASVASALRLAVENERLHAKVEAQLHEVRASRARIVAAGDAERKRVERDLHDGAQQRLVALTLALRLARSKLGDDGDAGVRRSLEQASDDAKAALGELRELAHGIHPQILTAAGLASALESLADRSPVHVSLDVGGERYPPAVEATAYFVVSEALANIAKYAGADHVVVRTSWADGFFTVEVADDGVGGADPDAGTGLRGLADRLGAIDGSLEVISPTGGGTRVLAHMPSLAAPGLAGLAL